MTDRLTRSIGVGAMLAGLLTGFLLWWAGVAHRQALRAAAPSLVAATRPMPAAAMLAGALRDAIVAQPLDQDLVNRYYTLASINRLVDRQRLAGWRVQMAKLGWRSTPAQQNLLGAAATDGDLRTIFDRTDALIRREQLTGEIVALLYVIEQAPQTHPELVRRLERNVPWRATFFADPRGVATPAGRQARFETLTGMLAAGHPVRRAEIAPLLAAMTAAGDDVPADRLWRTFRGQRGQGHLPAAGQSFDPDFAVYADAQRQLPTSDLPFEWQPLSGDGYSVDVSREGATLHWDGNGVPLLLRQTFHAVRGPYELVLGGSEATPEFFHRFEVAAVCPGGESLFTQLRPGADGSVVARSERPVTCDYPFLGIRGRASMVSQPIDASLSTILLRPSRG